MSANSLIYNPTDELRNRQGQGVNPDEGEICADGGFPIFAKVTETAPKKWRVPCFCDESVADL